DGGGRWEGWGLGGQKALATGLQARAFALQMRFVFSFSGFLGDFGLVGRLDRKDWFLMVTYCWIGLKRGGLVILVESLLGSFALGLQEITKWAIAFERRVRRWVLPYADKAQFDASLYAFFRDGLFDEFELGGLQDDTGSVNLHRIVFDEEEDQIFTLVNRVEMITITKLCLAKRSAGSNLKHHFCPNVTKDMSQSKDESPAHLQVVALGRPSFSSINGPQPLLEVESQSPSVGNIVDRKSYLKTPEQVPMLATRITIKHGHCLVLDVDDIDRLLQFCQPQDGGSHRSRWKREAFLQELATLLQLVDLLGPSNSSHSAPVPVIMFLRVVSLPRGRKLLSCYLQHLMPGKQPPLCPLGSHAGDGASVIIKSVLDRATELVTGHDTAISCSIPSRNAPNAAVVGPEFTQVIIRDVPVDLLCSGLPHNNEHQRELLLDFVRRTMIATRHNSPWGCNEPVTPRLSFRYAIAFMVGGVTLPFIVPDGCLLHPEVVKAKLTIMDYSDSRHKPHIIGKVFIAVFLIVLCILITKKSTDPGGASLLSLHVPGATHVLVTGGAGYIGSHAVLRLLKDSYRVTVVDNLSRGNIGAIKVLQALFPEPGRLQFIYADLGNARAVNKIFAENTFDAVMHFAAVAYVGESMLEPLSFQMELEFHIQVPINPYGKAKKMAEDIILDFSKNSDMGVMILRYFNVIGSDPEGRLGEAPRPELREHGRISGACFDAALGIIPGLKVKGTDYPTRDGTCIRDYIDVTDLVDAHVKALDKAKPRSVGIYNVGTGKGITVKEFVEACKKATGADIKVEYLSRRPGDYAEVYSDPSKINRELNWTAHYTDLEKSLSIAWRWQKSHRNGYGSP
ncbi:UDP-arabinose 4-epimerase, partial [Musa troglodytarum]